MCVEFLDGLVERLREVLGDERYVVEVCGKVITIGRRVLGDPAWSFAQVYLEDMRSGGSLRFVLCGTGAGRGLDLSLPESDPVGFVVGCLQEYDNIYQVGVTR